MTHTTQTEDELVPRKKAAQLLNVAPGSLAVYDSLNRYDLKPEKKDGRIYYRMSAVLKEKERRLAKQRRKRMILL